MLWKCYISWSVCNSLFNSALPGSGSHCHVAYSNISWLETSELRQMDEFACGYVRMADIITIAIISAIAIIATTIIYSSWCLAAPIFGWECSGVQLKSSITQMAPPQASECSGLGQRNQGHSRSDPLLLLKQLLFLAGIWWEEADSISRKSFLMEKICMC